MQTGTKPQTESTFQSAMGEISLPEIPLEDSREWQAARMRVLWGRRRLFFRAAAIGLLASTCFAFLIPKRYTSTTQLMPPDSQSASGMAMMAAFAAKGGGLGAMAGDLLGMKSTGALFVGILRSQTSQDRLVEQFDLKQVYGKRLVADARLKLDENTSISEDRKSGIISVSVTDRSAQRAAALASAYINQLNTLVVDLSTSSARREKDFLEQRLKLVKQDLDDASNQLAQFSSKNNTLDIQQEGKAMLDAAALLAGQLVAAQSQLEGLKQIYTDSNPRVQSLKARVGELRKQLEKLSGTNGKSGGKADLARDTPGSMPYPSIRNLPLLGVQYADYYRHAKIQETVYELLTEQYEMAKVQEAKETPTVRVLDAAQIPEKQSSPARLMIIFFGVSSTVAGALVFVFVVDRWQTSDPNDPRKVLIQEVAGTLKLHAPWTLGNGNGVGWMSAKRWSSVRKNRLPEAGE